MKIITKKFFTRPALEVAEGLIGKLIVRKIGSETIGGRILETEAYIGEEDKACHARFGRTKRNEPMYLEGGRTYVYLCYGIHDLLNIVTGKEDEPEAVLIRKIETLNVPTKQLGPGSLTKFLKINRDHNNLEIKGKGGEIYFLDDGYIPISVSKAERVGIGYAEEYRDKPWRFIAK